MSDNTQAAEPKMTDTYIVDVAGNVSIIKTQVGLKYKAGEPLGPHGSVVATAAQIEAYKAAQQPPGA